MMDTDAFWALVHDHLDARRDPLDDVRVQLYLSNHAELLEEFANLTHAVDTLWSPPATRTPLRRHIAGVAAIVLLALGAGLYGFWDAEPDRIPPDRIPPDLVLPDLATAGQVMQYSSRYFIIP